MRLIDTSVVTSSLQYPGLANVGGQSVGNPIVGTAHGNPAQMQGLDFLQQALLDMVDALVKAQVVDPTKPTWIYQTGLPPRVGTIGGGLSSYTAYTTSGYVYYNGEVFFVPSQYIDTLALDGGGGGSKFIANIIANPTDNGSPAPLTTLSDGSTNVSIHNQRTIAISVNTSSGNFPDFGSWETLENNFAWAAPTITVVPTGAYKTGWSQNTRLMLYLLGNEVTIQGDANYAAGAAQTIFDLPYGVVPKYLTVVPVVANSSTVGALSIDTAGSIKYLGDTSAGGTINMVAKYTIL